MAAAAPSARVDALLGSAGAALDPDSAIELADAALASGREAEAVQSVAESARRHPDHALLWQWSGLLHRALDQHEAALAAFSAATRLAPDDALLAHSVARTAFESGLPAVALFERAAGLAPANSGVLRGRAAARCAAGEADVAIAEIDALLDANPGWIEGHEVIGQLRWMRGHRDEFTAATERALTKTPLDPQLWRLLLSQLIHAGQFEQALELAERGHAVLGDHVVILANKAIALAELRQDREADQLFDRLANFPDISIRVQQIRHLIRTQRIDAAAQLGESLVESSDAKLIWPYLGLAWRLLGDARWDWLDQNGAFIRTFDLSQALAPLDSLANLLRDLHRVAGQPLDQSPRGGTQTDGNLFQRIEPEIRQLRGAVTDAVQRYVEDLPPVDPRHPLLRHRRDRPVRFAGAWSVRLTAEGYHISHNHPLGWISSALYVAVPPAVADTLQAGRLAFGMAPDGLGLDLPRILTVEPKPAKLVLFPSTTWHGTLPFPSGERMSVAFDVALPAP